MLSKPKKLVKVRKMFETQTMTCSGSITGSENMIWSIADRLKPIQTHPEKVAVREYRASDLEEFIRIYQSGFAEAPWNEYMKCPKCEANYGRSSIETVVGLCSKCDDSPSLVEYWPAEQIEKDLKSEIARKDSIVLVAEHDRSIVGATVGYAGVPEDRKDFLKSRFDGNSFYIDELVVDASARRKGTGYALSTGLIREAQKKGYSQIFLRTNRFNPAAVNLYEKLGFIDTGLRDPEFKDRMYMVLEIGKDSQINDN